MPKVNLLDGEFHSWQEIATYGGYKYEKTFKKRLCPENFDYLRDHCNWKKRDRMLSPKAVAYIWGLFWGEPTEVV